MFRIKELSIHLHGTKDGQGTGCRNSVVGATNKPCSCARLGGDRGEDHEGKARLRQRLSHALGEAQP